MFRYESIKWKYLIILLVIFTIVISVRIYFDNKHYKYMLNNRISVLTEDVEKAFNQSKVNIKNKYKMLNTHFMNNKNLTTLFKTRKRDKLHELLNNDYLKYKQIDSHLQVMHFIDTNNTTVLRMHKPQSYNDNLTKKRPIVVYANKSLQEQYAFEVGKNGIVYRITTPYIYNKQHIGVLEFGIKPGYFVDALNNQFQIKSQILVKTDSLKTLMAQKKYKQIGEYSIISSDKFFNKISKMIDLNKASQVIKIGKKTYIISTNLNLENYQNETVAKIIIAKDITKFIEEKESSLMLINSFTFAVFLFILVILYEIFTKYSKELEETLEIVNKLHKKSNHFENKSNMDNLTKAYNKAYFDKYLDRFLKIKEDGVLIFIDIDHFKNINDTYGHLAGDDILIQLSKTINDFLRTDDIFVRWGGEEFIILLQDIQFELAIKKSESLRLLIEDTKFTKNISVTISLGVTKIKEEDSKKTLLTRADKLLYKAKKNGRNCIEYD